LATHLVDQQGARVAIGRQIGRTGGEGSCYEATSHPGFLVKIYHQAPSEDKAEKIYHLAQLASSNLALLNFAAWPTSIVWKDGQRPCGFLMPEVKGKEIHQLFSPKEREVEFPTSGWDFLVHVARNCAAAFDSVHEIGVVIGDVNEGNLLVTNNGTVRLIDCDSYQVQNGARRWTCDVGIPLWTPPELQGKNFRQLERTANHDRFGLAVLVFKLLFMGRHPYAGIPLQPVKDFDLQKAIANYMFAFGPKSYSLGLRPPPHCLSLSAFPPSYIERFERSFLRGSENGRPTAENWAQAMEALLQNINKCGRDPSHKYPRNLPQCPWCEIAGAGGPNFFISVTVVMPGLTVNLADLWSAIARIEENTLSVKSVDQIQVPSASPQPLPAGVSKIRPQFVLGCVLIAVAVVLIFSGYAAPGIGAILIALGLMSGGRSTREYTAEYSRRKSALDQAQREISRLSQELSGIPTLYKSEFTKRRTELRQAYERYSRLDKERATEMQKLEQKKRELQLREYLDRQIIRRAGIEGIGPGRIAALQAYGIESALDVRPNMSVPGIGDTYRRRLMEWRRFCESNFRFNAAAPIPPQEIQQLNARMMTLRNQLVSDLKQGPQLLANLGAGARSRIAQLEAQLEVAVFQQTQAAADMNCV
jgi:DNA-binding helix-hairpin-helix protein with protein kinase domain